jgi:hypothetical protein
MNCEWIKENVSSYIYDELADDTRYEMESHLERCPGCKTELAEMRELRDVLSALPRLEPSPNLLTAARMKLQESLETTEQAPSWRRLVFDPVRWLTSMRFQPALAAMLVIVGFAGGVGTAFVTRPDVNKVVDGPTVTPITEASILGIRGVITDPETKQVEVRYDMLQPQTVQGSIEDPKIQQLLLMAAQNPQNSGVRMDSIDLLTQKPQDDAVRQALVSAVRHDKNPGVRLRAIQGLEAYVKDDVRVRDAVVDALLHDDNPGVRTEAIRLLQPVKADGTVRTALATSAQTDQNKYIRTRSQQTLATIPEID